MIKSLLPSTASSRDYALDITKGIGILAIIVSHIYHPFNGLLFSFHVPLFFLLAGYFFKDQPLRDAIEKDARRLLLPYIYTCLSIIFFDLLEQLLHNKPYDPYWIFAAFYGSGGRHSSRYLADLPSIGAIWFLLALFWSKLAFSLIRRYCSRFTGPLCVSLSILATLIDRYLINLPFSILPGISALVFFYIGWGIKTAKSTKKENRRSNLIVNIFLIICILCWFIVLYLSQLSKVRLSLADCFYKFYPLEVAGAIGGTLVIHLISKLVLRITSLISACLTWIGSNSICFLCIHLFELETGIRFFFRIDSGIHWFVFTLFFCILGTLVLYNIPYFRGIFIIKPFFVPRRFLENNSSQS